MDNYSSVIIGPGYTKHRQQVNGNVRGSFQLVTKSGPLVVIGGHQKTTAHSAEACKKHPRRGVQNVAGNDHKNT